MSWLTLIGISLGLAMDAFAVAIAAGLTLSQITHRHVFRLAFHFGLFQFIMPIIGWLAGQGLSGFMGGYDHWAAFLLLNFVGGKMLWEARHRDEGSPRNDPTRGLTLVTLSIATSLDALAVGLSMALLGVSVWGPSIVIGVVAAGMTALGVYFGGRIGPRCQRWAELAGGVVLILIGANILWSHLAG